MRVDGIVYADDTLIEEIRHDPASSRCATSPTCRASSGVDRHPDIHWGYGFPIGGVAAMDADEGVISPGGVGYDIN